ncbi:two-pore potassium channel 1 isoform X2 [Prunus yedoensis var. nudiflora]|uniref:Two-pore potassium channel 1 isoform X2 n=1 Tax=Prunus yedoensis var. nudiflora TaxID=2094558 RepID=A0A314XNS7_PRUYE|nr:two-pore potassium channel 1 isoform X2 [Prunus yedoensis var. nudiflora]
MEWTLKEWTSERHTWDENGMRPSGFQIPPLSSYFLFVVKNYPVGSSRVLAQADQPLCNALMASDHDDVKQGLLSENKEPAQLNNETNEVQRRRNRQYGSTPCPSFKNRLEQNEAGSQCPADCESIYVKPQFSLKQVILMLVAYIGGGTFCFFLMRHQIRGKKTNAILDSMYLCVVTMSTVGYGDLVPNSMLAKLVACFYVFTGMALVGLILGKAADYIVEKQEILLVRAIHFRDKIGPPELLKEVETEKVKFKCVTVGILLLLLVIVGTVFLCLVENLEVMDAFYCVCSTITTLGYGDESFSTGGGRIFAVFWILSSTICLAQFFLYLAELYTERRQRSLVKWVLTRRLTLSDLEDADLDHDKVVGAAEFIVYKLKEMGKICQEDISLVMETFKKLDIDHSGTLTASDLAPSHSQPTFAYTT